MGWGIAAMAAMNYLSSKNQSDAMSQASTPLPTYYQEYQSPQQQQMWNTLYPTIQNMQSGPTAGWYSGLDENVRAGIEEPYMKGMDMMRNQLSGTGMLGNQSAGMSGAAADVFGQYMQQAAPTMAQTGWDMMMQPYQGAMSMIPTTYSDLLVGNTPTIQQIQPGAALPPDYQQQLQEMMQQYMVSQNSPYGQYQQDWGLGIGTGLGIGSGSGYGDMAGFSDALGANSGLNA